MTHSTANQTTLSKLLAANGDCYETLEKSGSCNNDISEKQFVSVKEYRDSIDWLFRQCNVHYHSCVGLGEFRSFGEQLVRVFGLVVVLDCKRAKDDDRVRFEKAINSAIITEQKNLDRINKLELLKQAIKNH
jgi:hypothetical protein